MIWFCHNYWTPTWVQSYVRDSTDGQDRDKRLSRYWTSHLNLFVQINQLIFDKLVCFCLKTNHFKRQFCKRIAPIFSWGGCDVDYEWQVPSVEYWLKKNNFKKKN